MNQEDQLLKDLFKSSEEMPSAGITEKVMHRIDQSFELFEYKPLISKNAWIVIGSVFFTTLIYLILLSEEMAVKTPELITIFSSGLQKVSNSFSVELGQINFPKIPSPFLIALGAFNVIGVYLIISYKWSRNMFR